MHTNSFVQLHQTPKHESYMSTNTCQVRSKGATQIPLRQRAVAELSSHHVTKEPPLTPLLSLTVPQKQGILFGQKRKLLFLGPKIIKKETRIHDGVATDRPNFPVKKTRYHQ